jgi:hypothetical protein
MLIEVTLRLLNIAPIKHSTKLAENYYLIEGPEFQYTRYINGLGLRDYRELIENGLSKKIIFIGDSFTFGTGVSNYETFSAIAEMQLSERTGYAFYIMNAGKTDTGTYKQKKYLDQLLNKITPEAVMLFYFIDNDPFDTWMEWNQEKKISSFSEEPIYAKLIDKTRDWISSKFTLYQFLKTRLSTVGTLRAYPYTFLDQCEKRKLDLFAKQDKLTRKLLGEIQATLKKRGIMFIVAMIPRQEQVSEIKFNEFITNYVSDVNRFQRDLPQQRLKKNIFEPLGITILDLLPYFESYNDSQKLFFPVDGHLSKAGHVFLSNTIVPFIINEMSYQALHTKAVESRKCAPYYD